ncbi:glycosyltransferase [Adlercreutzia sp. R25]|uniref:glycosyltransferase n=1 Tax=Adlercreutzia shanghongiae TaxID=3111773 RepID=UPI002DBCC7DA|nr:glycosyltransferase [Adlercreutzia sp. R25]MEC4273414.1 glycosyltransferase [Adlercreutzia sp. R25]
MNQESLRKANPTASIIIPVYNKEDYLEDCFATLLEQTIDRDELEVVFVDDGSDDGSLELLRRFSAEHPWAKVVAKKNGGVSSARNAGINAAVGKYLFFLDPDDRLSPETIQNVSAFFDTCYDEVDLVTYPIVPMKNDKVQALHFRYDVLTKSGVYDLAQGDNYLICQTTMNVCVKNRFGHNVVFDFHPENGVEIHEDQKYITDILMEKMKIGFCCEAQYTWMKNADSVTNNYMKPYYIYDNTLGLYEYYFSRYPDSVPRYLQALLLHDVGWKMASHILLPVHRKGAEYDASLNRLARLLDHVEDELILTHPSIKPYHRFFVLRLKNRGKLDCSVGNRAVVLKHEEKIVYASDTAELLILRIAVRKGGLLLIGCIKSPAFLDFNGSVGLRAKRKPVNPSGCVRYEDIPLEISSRSYNGEKVMHERFYSFRYSCALGDSENISLEFYLGDSRFGLKWSIWGRAASSYALHDTRIVDQWRVFIDDEANRIAIRKLSDIKRAEKSLNARIPRKKTQFDRYLIRKKRDTLRHAGRTVWLYTDSIGKTDNAWLQFLHDSQISDNVDRYYAKNGVEPNEKCGKFGKVIPFGGRLHKLLFCNADKLICSDVAFKCFCPMEGKAFKSFTDLFNAEIVYTQHGVLWAHLPWFYSYDQILFDKEVVSTEFERRNLVNNYGFHESDLIPSGMPRYDLIDVKQRPKNRILLCPSWRSYLIGPLTAEGRKPLNGKFLASDYYKEINAFLCDPRLTELLEKHDFHLDFRLHPLFKVYEELFDLGGNRVHMAPACVSEADYAMAITDYSSYSFDFVYLKRALAYFIPDADLFFGGINHYSELDIDLSEAFGPFVKNADAMLDALEEFFANGALPLPLYQERMDGFFYHYDEKNRERLLAYLTQEEVEDANCD